MAVDPLVKHKDPQWWRRSPLATSVQTTRDLCDFCGHVRWMHVTRCTAASSALVGDPVACPCDKTADEGLWRVPVRVGVRR